MKPRLNFIGGIGCNNDQLIIFIPIRNDTPAHAWVRTATCKTFKALNNGTRLWRKVVIIAAILVLLRLILLLFWCFFVIDSFLRGFWILVFRGFFGILRTVPSVRVLGASIMTTGERIVGLDFNVLVLRCLL